MSNYDVVIRNGTVATAADVMRCDVGIAGGQLGHGCENGLECSDCYQVCCGCLSCHDELVRRQTISGVCPARLKRI